jgi:hypothetical protein
MVDLERATTFAETAADRNIPAEVCVAIYVQRVLRRRRADAYVCAGCRTIQAVELPSTRALLSPTTALAPMAVALVSPVWVASGPAM